MLVLTRKPNQSILIGDNIRIVVTEVRGHRVTIGIDAPKDVAILRDELVVPEPTTSYELQGADATC